SATVPGSCAAAPSGGRPAALAPAQMWQRPFLLDLRAAPCSGKSELTAVIRAPAVLVLTALRGRIMTAKRAAGSRSTHDVRTRRSNALTCLLEIRIVLDRYDEQRHSDLWIDIDDIMGKGIG